MEDRERILWDVDGIKSSSPVSHHALRCNASLSVSSHTSSKKPPVDEPRESLLVNTGETTYLTAGQLTRSDPCAELCHRGEEAQTSMESPVRSSGINPSLTPRRPCRRLEYLTVGSTVSYGCPSVQHPSGSLITFYSCEDVSGDHLTDVYILTDEDIDDSNVRTSLPHL